MDNIQTELRYSSKTVPIDIRIVAGLFYAYAIYLALGASLLTMAAGRTPDSEPIPVLCGTLLLTSYASRAAYLWILAGLLSLCAWGLRRQRLFAWWLSLLLVSYVAMGTLLYIIDDPSHRRPFQFISLGICVALLTWLYCRRRLFGKGVDKDEGYRKMRSMDAMRRTSAPLALVGAGIVLMVCLFYAVGLLAMRADIREVHQKRARLLRETDYHALLAACRELSYLVLQGDLEARAYSARTDPEAVSGFPPLLTALEPTHVTMRDDGRVFLELDGGLLHFGVRAYPKDFNAPYAGFRYGDRELIPGLWFYDEDYKLSHTLQQEVDRLIKENKPYRVGP